MTQIKWGHLILEKKDNIIDLDKVGIFLGGGRNPFIVQNATKTRIRRDNSGSVCVNAPSRDIKKWFSYRI